MPSWRRRYASTCSASACTSSRWLSPSQRPSSLRSGSATGSPSTLSPTKPTRGGTASLAGRSRQANVPATRWLPGARRTVGTPCRDVKRVGCPSTVTSRGQMRSSPGSGTACSSPTIVQRCTNVPLSVATSIASLPGQAQTKFCAAVALLSCRNGQRRCSWPCSTQFRQPSSSGGTYTSSWPTTLIAASSVPTRQSRRDHRTGMVGPPPTFVRVD